MIDFVLWSSLLLSDNYQEEHANSTVIASFLCGPPAWPMVTEALASVPGALRDLWVCLLSSLEGWPLVDDKCKGFICIRSDSPKLGSDPQFLLPYLRCLKRCACRHTK